MEDSINVDNSHLIQELKDKYGNRERRLLSEIVRMEKLLKSRSKIWEALDISAKVIQEEIEMNKLHADNEDQHSAPPDEHNRSAESQELNRLAASDFNRVPCPRSA
eukprot:767787-Hanusia_phi.AAC.3